jgi:hypothetical protein
MLSEFTPLYDAYKNLVSSIPWWGTAIFVLFHLVAFLICMGREDNQPFSVPQAKNAPHLNTVNAFLWFSVMLAFPVVGVLAYVLLGILPYVIWKKLTKSEECPFVFPPLRAEFLVPVIAGVAGALLADQGFVKELHGNQNALSIPFGFECALFAWIAVMFVSWLSRRNIVGFVKPAGYDSTNVNAGSVFGIAMHHEYDEPSENKRFARQEASAARRAVSHKWLTELETDYPVGQPFEDRSFDFVVRRTPIIPTTGMDVVDTHYCGRGVVRVEYLDWATKAEGFCYKHHCYVVAPSVYGWFIRLLTVLLFLFVLFVPEVQEWHIAILEKLQEIITGFIK